MRVFAVLIAMGFFFPVFGQWSLIEAKHAAYIEAGGPSYYYSVGYENRVAAGFRLSGGLSVYPTSNHNGSALGFPVSAGYVVGRNNSKVEAGLALFPVFASNKKFPGFDNEFSGFRIIPSFHFGYRYEPIEEGIMLRIRICPIIAKNSGITNFGLTIGYCFKDLEFYKRMKWFE